MLNVVVAPGEVFDHVKRSPFAASNWVFPTLILMIITLLGSVLVFNQEDIIQPMFDAVRQQMDTQVEAGRMSQTDADRAFGISKSVMSVAIIAGGALYALVSPLVWGLVIWLVGAKILKGGFTFGKALEVAGLGNVIVILHSLLKTLLILATGNLFVVVGPALFIPDFNSQTNPMHGLIAIFDVMTFWSLIVLSIGMAKLSGKSLTVAASWLFGVWVVIIGMMVGLGFLGRMFQPQ